MAIDMVMMFIKDGTPVDAGSLAEINPNDEFFRGFVAGKFFDIDSFEMGINLVDQDTTLATKKEDKEKGGRFSKWVQNIMPVVQPGSRLFPLEMEPVSFSRKMDNFSPLLFQLCFKTKTFDQVSVVKRQVFHKADAGVSLPFLRVDFKQVLVTALDWDIEEEVKEKCKFVCRSVAVKFRPQKQRGTPGATIGGEELKISEK